MRFIRLATLGTGLLTFALAMPARSATTLDREFRYPANRVTLADRDGLTHIGVKGAMREFRPGRPDLPTVGERVEIPVGFRLTGVEVTGVETEPLGTRSRVASAPVVQHGTGPEELSAPDNAFYMRRGFQPERLVEIGTQGFEGEHNVAWLSVAAVRWDAQTGELERVSRIQVRLTLEPSTERPIVRERIVREWEDERLPGGGVSAARAALTSISGDDRRAQPFRPTQVPSLLGSPVAYVIVTNDSMAAAFQGLADWKTQSGLPAVVRTTSFIRQQYPYGSDDAERIRMFIRDAYTRWGTKWVLLGGDTDVIPARVAYTTFYGGENIPSDLYYGCLDGNWDADGDSTYGEAYLSSNAPGDNADMQPEVWVGRAPASSGAEAQRFVNKTLTYEKTPVSDYMTNMLFFAEVLFPQYWTPGTPTSLDGAELVEYDILPILDTVPWIHYGRLYENYTDARWRPGSLQELRATVLDSLNHGYNMAIHIGHGYRTVMSCGDDNITNNDASGLTNGNRLINLYAIDCTSNSIDFQSIGEAFIRAQNGGAVTNIGSTRFDFPTTGRYYQEEYFRLLFQDSVTAIGEAEARQKFPFLAYTTYDGVNRWTQLTMLLLGDPELRIYTNTPRILNVTVPGTLSLTDTTLAVNVKIGATPLYGARVTAYMPGDEYRTGTTDGAGNVTLIVRPDTVGSFTLTVTAFNAKPFQQTITVTPSGGAQLLDQAPVIVDDNLSGRHGNGNGILDAGELVDVRVALRNTGGGSAPNVNGTLSTADGVVSITVPDVGYGTISAGAVSSPSAGYRLSVPVSCPDQHEIPFSLSLVDGNGKHYLQEFQLVVRSPEFAHLSHTESETGGNNNGRPEPGETVTYALRLRNNGSGGAQGIYGRVRNYDGLATVLDTAFTVADMTPGMEAVTSPFRFVPSNTAAKLQILLYDQNGLVLDQPIDLLYPAAVGDLLAFGAASSIKLNWAHCAAPDLAGYFVYRSANQGGPYSRVNSNPTDRVSYYLDPGLAPLTRYYYEVSAVDSSGNESALSAPISGSTNPPLHGIFPLPTGGGTPSPITIEHMYSGTPLEVMAGSDLLYMVNADGTAPVDADGSSATLGDFTDLGNYYAGGGSISDLNGDGSKEVVAATWYSQELWAWDKLGSALPGFPKALLDQVWSSVAVGDLNNDGTKEMVFGSRGSRFYAFRSNGTELMDGDSNPGTVGVFKVLGQAFNDGTPGIVDLLGNGTKYIIYGSFDGNVYAWKSDGTSAPGFPVNLHAPISASVAIGKIDGAGGGVSIVIPATNDSVYVLKADGGRHAGFPVWFRTTGNSRTPSPALADMNNDGFLDLVLASTNGGIYVINHTGALVPPWSNIRYSTLNGAASESSPVVADINGDGFNDVIMGDETGNLAALSGATGTMLAGFPIQLEAEVKGTPAVCDCDGDGLTEVVVAGWDRNIYMWDYDFPFSPGGVPPWPQFHHDAERTGYAGTPILLDAGGNAAPPAALEFAAPWPNPARGSLRLAWGVPQGQSGESYELAVFDLAGRRVQTVEQGVAHPGRFSAAWNLRDATGAPVLNGVYFLRLSVGARAATRKLIVLH